MESAIGANRLRFKAFELDTHTRELYRNGIRLRVQGQPIDVLEMLLERLSTALEAGESVKISGFGTFSVRQKGRRIGRNPKTGIEVPILPRRVLVFRPSQVLKAHVNHMTPPAGDDE